MTLFPNNLKALVSAAQPTGTGKRLRTTIPTGAPRLVESPSDRASRAPTETWAALLDVVRRSAAARLVLLERRSDQDRIGCPWKRITGCDNTCRCGGLGMVTVALLRTHYELLAIDIATLARPAFAFVRRSS